MRISTKFPKEFKIVECIKGKQMLPIGAIADKIKKIVEKKFS